MRKIIPCKLLASVVLLALLLIIPTFVDAYSGEIDPKNYISLPVYLNSKDGIINSTIYISSSAGNSYNLYYKVMELKESEFNEINMKKNEYEETVASAQDEAKKIAAEEKLKVDKAKEECDAIENDSTKTEEEKAEARKAYNKAIDEYNAKAKELNSMVDEKDKQAKQKYYSYLPFSDDNWTQTTDKKMKINTSDFSEKAHFILWAKLSNSEGTYYEYRMYSIDVPKNVTLSLDKTTAEIKVGNTLQLKPTTSSNKSITWTSDNENIATVDSSGLVSGVAEGVATITAEVEGQKATCVVTVKKSTEQNEEDYGLKWTDFSSARITLESNGKIRGIRYKLPYNSKGSKSIRKE